MTGSINDGQIETEEVLHVFDLPQLYQKPEADALLKALHRLAPSSSTFGLGHCHARQTVDPKGVPGYLTSTISSPLDWMSDDDKEQIWQLASMRLNQRSGSGAAPTQTRCFEVNDDLTVRLHEPSLTEDNLGFKTWASSLLMSKRLAFLQQMVPVEERNVLELGAGTGLVGISAACLWKTSVTLTDLPEIVPNLKKNLHLNADLIVANGGRVYARALDWSDTSDKPKHESDKFSIILAADPIYSPDHPKMLAERILIWLRRGNTSRVIIELPLREHYAAERSKLSALLDKGGLSLMTEGTETGFDDWQDSDGTLAEVKCWWGVWKPR